MIRPIDANFAQHIANVELSSDNAGIVQWVLSHTPTIDAELVVHGQWECTYDKELGTTDVTCSCCNITRTINGCYVTSTGESCYFEDNYCPNCGSYMRERKRQ